MASSATFFARLEARCRAVNSLLCVGLDPHRSELEVAKDATLEELAAAAEKFCVNLINQTSHVAVAYKPNAAFFEALGTSGAVVLERVCKAIPKECLVVYDCKRGDIATTAEAYAEAAYGVLNADAVTIHPYMGWDSVEPFIRDKSRGAFVLVKTSNKSSDELQSARMSSSSFSLFETVARKCVEWNAKAFGSSEGSNTGIGMVVGATDADALRRSRKQAPELWILAPGVGFQGGDLDAAVTAGIRTSDGLGLLVPVSRGISRAKDPRKAAEDLRDQLNASRDRAMSAATAATTSSSSNNKRARVAADAVAPHQALFFELAIRCGVLKFGTFKLKSGRESPYFFNAGLFSTGSAVDQLATCYAQAIVDSGLEFDVLFGPAYKGIPLAASVAAKLYSDHGRDVPFCYNRKEEKDHGEGGVIVGASVTGNTRVLILDDVITAGTAVREAVKIIHKAGGAVVGLVVAIDRQEVVTEGQALSAVESVKAEFQFDVLSIVNLDTLLAYSGEHVARIGGDKVLEDIRAYRAKYGVASSSSSA